jgi:hypothetical protein
MLSEAQPWVIAREVRAREMTWTTAERTRRGQPRGSGREWDRVFGDMSSLPEKRQSEEVGDSISL